MHISQEPQNKKDSIISPAMLALSAPDNCREAHVSPFFKSISILLKINGLDFSKLMKAVLDLCDEISNSTRGYY
ncbi:hypothetical protein SAMN02910340_01101 [Methanosarcina thermophila]|jgi:hypothetical protein|uniref:Uncharacterized protein n=1 Tax=Methanosarcina thermophila TaxID=2210 RepID=A0A1I6YS52_METTE|nr:hypothetical protein [Methanosarcina thermophila]ALK05116.1 MAG: hypothetical protein AAY43_04620 [Methanosarcina sp. 795]NLU56362.1 hypothetical protein [Methanosarcina thermophila]SFT53282.1 hypothetical protein SAMN02910340_01101 [Methanosarcina thermophila]HOA68392.1 hypothetical protein [Methanosarcina thermophila]HOQ65712.1 hypothetical protein [Methanosarcina thermophila]